MSDRAHIYVHPDTRDRLRAAKVGDDSYDDVLTRLLDEHGVEVRRHD